MSTIRKLFVYLFIFFAQTSHGALIISGVPFQNVFLNPGDSVRANFNFGAHSVLFCFATNTQIVGLITWPLNGVIQAGNLPIFLTVNPLFTGSFTDPVGVLQISNNSKQFLQVGCLFGY